MNLKGLTGAMVYDSLASATGYKPNQQEEINAGRPFDQGTRSQFMARFALIGKRTEAPTSILQALMLMNGRFVTDMTTLEKGDVLAAVADASFLDTAAKIETLFLAALTRKPNPDEAERYGSYVDRGGPTNDPYNLLVDSFDVWWLTLIYLVAMAALGLHLHHGVWSARQTLGLTNNAKARRDAKTLGWIVAVVIAGGFSLVPIFVLVGVISK